MATLLKVLNNLADIRSAGGVALRVRTQGAMFGIWLAITIGEPTNMKPGSPPGNGSLTRPSLRAIALAIRI
jgi:hypothetical protein